jgi:hypothetical protein
VDAFFAYIGTDFRHASANSAGTLGVFDLESSTKLDICAHARPVWIGPDKDSVADGSTSSIDEGAWLGINPRLSDALGVILCAATTANSDGNAKNNLMIVSGER